MPRFKSRDWVSFVDDNGVERDGTLLNEISDETSHYVFVREFNTGAHLSVNSDNLLKPKGPYFEIRGQVLTTGPGYRSKVGEIVGTAKSATNNPFFKVRFEDGVEIWFSADDVYIDNKVREEWLIAINE